MAKQVLYVTVRVEIEVDSEEAAREIIEDANYTLTSDVEGAIVDTEIVDVSNSKQYHYR